MVGQGGAHKRLDGAKPPSRAGHFLFLGLAPGRPLNPEAAPISPGRYLRNDISGILIRYAVRQ